jgi:DNA polymerase elongation subunit (family B)
MGNLTYRDIFCEINETYGGFRLYDVQSKGANGLVSIRTGNGKRLNLEIPFKPYFFVPKCEISYHKPFLPLSDVKKIVLEHPAQVKEERQKYRYTYEADILYNYRIHFDILHEFSETDSVLPRIWFFDIEVFNDGSMSFPKPEETEKIINSISIYDTYSKKYLTIVVAPEGKDTGKIINEDRIVIKVRNEELLLKMFLGILQDIQPDIISGWNIMMFDIPFLIERMRIKYPDMLNKISPFKVQPREEIDFRTWKKRYNIVGICLMDYMLLYKKYGDRVSSYSLEFISQYELGEGKVKYKGTLDELWLNDFNKFVEYNIEDVNLVKKLEEKLDFIYMVDIFKSISKTHIETFNFDNTTKVGDFLIMDYIRKSDIPLVMRTKPEKVEEGSKYKGAFVRRPKVGLYHDYIIDFDASSMYPSIIRTLNISPDTFVCRVIEDWDFIRNELRHYLFGRSELTSLDGSETVKVSLEDGTIKTMSVSELKKMLYEICNGNNFTVATNGAIFTTTKVGILKLIEDDLAKLRTRNKNARKTYGKLIHEVKSGFLSREKSQ